MWIKICGITDRTIAAQVVNLEPDAIGLNFYAKSPRCVTSDAAQNIVAQLPETVRPIGLFVNHPLEEILETCRNCQLATVQLHGDETPEFMARLHERLQPLIRNDQRQNPLSPGIVRAFRVDASGLTEVAQTLERLARLGVTLSACLIDARISGAYGGTGHQAPWEVIAKDWNTAAWPPLILAGGIRPDNVSEAIHMVHPWGIDVASGVESSPGRQDPQLVRSLIQAAR